MLNINKVANLPNLLDLVFKYFRELALSISNKTAKQDTKKMTNLLKLKHLLIFQVLSQSNF